MVKKQLEQDLKRTISSLGFKSTDIVCSIPKNPKFGDYTTNSALQLAKLKSSNGKQSPTDIANKISSHLRDLDYLGKVEIAGNGFINFFLKDQILLDNLNQASHLDVEGGGQKILIEYGHVNPLKEIHIGHLRTFILGESLARVMESSGYKVFRANYQGDIGLHIAKAIWGMRKLGLPSKKLSNREKAEFMGKAYAEGTLAYDQDPQAKLEIDEMTRQLYEKSDHELMEQYQLARGWSLEYFEPIYQLLGIKYDQYFFESQVYQDGLSLVRQNIGKVFIEDQGAVIFPGEKYGLHNRVFITTAGNPTYEAKDIGLAKAEYEAFPYDLSIHVVANEQAGYFQVVFKAIEALFPKLKGKKYHLSYGFVDLKEGKMSSRTGNVITVDDLVSVTEEKVREIMKKSKLNIDQDIVKKVALGAIKFSYLKYSPEPNMVFDLKQSVSLMGDSGPYLQYTYARIKSVLRKAEEEKINSVEGSLDQTERALLRQLIYFPQIVQEVCQTYHPNLLASYLIELAKLYNLFYQKSRILGSDKQGLRLKISESVAEVLGKGLNLLGIEAPEKM